MTIDIEKLAKENGFVTHTADDGECYSDIETLKQFAEAYAAKVLEDKERENAENQLANSQFVKQFNEFKSHINDLREALEDTTTRLDEINDVKQVKIAGDIKCVERNKQLLSKTPAQSLQAHENEVIERCAKVCDEKRKGLWTVQFLASEIRELKVTE